MGIRERLQLRQSRLSGQENSDMLMIDRSDPYDAPPDEVWKPLPSYHFIEVSNYGRARCYLKLHMGKLFKYPRLNIKGVRQAVHVWVAELFIGPRPEGLVVNHIDGNPTNNHVSNLEYVTPQENNRKGRHTKLNPELVKKIREEFAAGGVTKVDLAKKYNVGSHQIGCVVLGRQWGDIA